MFNALLIHFHGYSQIYKQIIFHNTDCNNIILPCKNLFVEQYANVAREPHLHFIREGIIAIYSATKGVRGVNRRL